MKDVDLIFLLRRSIELIKERRRLEKQRAANDR